MKRRVSERLLGLALVILAAAASWSLLDSSPFFACRPISGLENETLAHDAVPADAKCYYVARGAIHFERDPTSNATVAIVSLTLFFMIVVLYLAHRLYRKPADRSELP